MGMPFAGRHAGGFMSRGLLWPGILLLLAEEPSHGYALMDRLAEMGMPERPTHMPVVYRVLRHMEREGLAVSDHVEQEGRGPARKVYRLTDDGMRALESWSERLEKTGDLIEEFQRRYESLPGRSKGD
jgi:PadR family transcriptional regulator PadR